MENDSAPFAPNAFDFSGRQPGVEEKRVGSDKSYFQDVCSRLLKHKVAMVSLGVILLILLFSLLTPVFSPYTYNHVDPNQSNLPPRIPVLEDLGILNGEQNGVNAYRSGGLASVYHYFGTDNLGRDIWTRVAQGTRISLEIAGAAVLVDILIGVLFGLISGYFGGRVDTAMQRIIEVLSGIPTLVIVTLLLLVLRPGLLNIILAMIFTGWINMSRIVRAQVLRLKNQEYVLASKTLGASSFSILFSDLLPNALGQIIVTFMFSIPNAIFTEAFLAFIGLSVQNPMASLGTLINDGYQSAMTYPYMIVAPVVVLGLLMLCFNLFADGLRDSIDPQMKQM